MDKFYKILIYIPCVLFAVWYLIASYLNIYACDDYWHGLNVQKYGFWGAQLFYWNNWEGSYTHTFFATLPHVFTWEKTPFAFNLTQLVLLILSCVYFLRTFFIIQKGNAIIVSIYVIAWLFCITTGGSEVCFWVCANNTYILGISTILLFISIYHKWFITRRVIDSIILVVLLFLIVGNKISYIYFLYITILAHDILFNRFSIKHFFIITMTISVFSLLNIMAPGNYERLSENLDAISVTSENYSFIETILYRISKFEVICLLFFILYPPTKLIKNKFQITDKTIGIISVALILIFLGDTLIMYICFRNTGPLRANILIECSIILYLLLLLKRIPVYVYSKKISKYFAVYVILVFCVVNCMQILELNNTLIYSQKAKIREQTIINSDKSMLLVEPLPNSGLLLSYFANDSVWLNTVYVPYYNKKIKIQIEKTNLKNNQN